MLSSTAMIMQLDSQLALKIQIVKIFRNVGKNMDLYCSPSRSRMDIMRFKEAVISSETSGTFY
jgi:hypothetical protein